MRLHPEGLGAHVSAFWIQCLADDMVDIADDRANDWTEREGPDGKKIRVFDNENFRSRKRQIGEVHWRGKKRPAHFVAARLRTSRARDN